jgi:hypothetical protein
MEEGRLPSVGHWLIMLVGLGGSWDGREQTHMHAQAETVTGRKRRQERKRAHLDEVVGERAVGELHGLLDLVSRAMVTVVEVVGESTVRVDKSRPPNRPNQAIYQPSPGVDWRAYLGEDAAVLVLGEAARVADAHLEPVVHLLLLLLSSPNATQSRKWDWLYGGGGVIWMRRL